MYSFPSPRRLHLPARLVHAGSHGLLTHHMASGAQGCAGHLTRASGTVRSTTKSGRVREGAPRSSEASACRPYFAIWALAVSTRRSTTAATSTCSCTSGGTTHWRSHWLRRRQHALPRHDTPADGRLMMVTASRQEVDAWCPARTALTPSPTGGVSWETTARRRPAGTSPPGSRRIPPRGSLAGGRRPNPSPERSSLEGEAYCARRCSPGRPPPHPPRRALNGRPAASTSLPGGEMRDNDPSPVGLRRWPRASCPPLRYSHAERSSRTFRLTMRACPARL